MSGTKYPFQIDSNNEIPLAIDNVTQVKSESVNTLRGAIFAVESELGIDPSREYGTVRARLDALEGLINALIAASDLQGGFAIEVRHDGAQVIAAATILDIVGGQVLVPDAGVAQIIITSGGDPQQESITVLTNGQTSFTLTNDPTQPETTMMFINGYKQTYGVDYTASGQIVTWLNTDYALETTDKIEFWYLIDAGSGGGGSGNEGLATVLSFGNATGGIDVAFTSGSSVVLSNTSKITSTGSIVLTDKVLETTKGLLIDVNTSIPTTPGTDKGLIWLRTSDNKLLFTDESSTTFVLNASLAQILTTGNITGGTSLAISHADKLLGKNVGDGTSVNLAYVDSSNIVNYGDDAFSSIFRGLSSLDFRLANSSKFTVGTSTIDFHSSKGINAATPTSSTDVANKAYVDSLLVSHGLGLGLILGHTNTTDGYDIVLSTGDSLTGIGGVVNIHATSGTFLSGSLTVAGNIDAQTHLVRNVVNPILAQDAATKNYVDTAIANVPVNDGYEVRIFGTATTVNNTVTNLASYTMSTANKTCAIEVKIIARDQTDGDSAGWKMLGIFERTGSTVSEIGESSIIVEEREDVSWSVDFVISGTKIYISGVGDASNNVKWRVVGNAIEDG